MKRIVGLLLLALAVIGGVCGCGGGGKESSPYTTLVGDYLGTCTGEDNGTIAITVAPDQTIHVTLNLSSVGMLQGGGTVTDKLISGYATSPAPPPPPGMTDTRPYVSFIGTLGVTSDGTVTGNGTWRTGPSEVDRQGTWTIRKTTPAE